MRKIKKGISLIVLVITIIVMIILAGAIILSLNNAGIIGNANKAVEMTNEAQINQIAQLGWAEAYASGARTVEDLTKGINKALEANGLNPEDYGTIVTTIGVEIKKGWIQDKLTVKKGSKTLEIGDTISYDAGVPAYTKGWKVLGASDKGELLIVSADNVTTRALGSSSNIEKAKTDYITGAKQLDDICATYVNKEKGATGARSIRVEDINKVTGYKPEIALYGKGGINEYGNKVTYTWNGGTNPAYTSTKGPKGTLTRDHNEKFIYYNGTEFVTSTNEGATSDEPIEITKLDSNYYKYYPTTLTTSSSGTVEGIGTGTKAYKMLFRDSVDSANSIYWLASPYVYTGTTNANFGLRFVYSGFVAACIFVRSEGYYNGSTDGVGMRAVVSLSYNIQVKEGTTTDWTF